MLSNGILPIFHLFLETIEVIRHIWRWKSAGTSVKVARLAVYIRITWTDMSRGFLGTHIRTFQRVYVHF